MAFDRNKLLSSAQKHLQNREWQKALDCYQKIIAHRPKDMRVLLNVGDLYARLDQTEDALNTYESVGDHYAQNDRYQKAVAVYKQALRVASDEPKLHQKVAESHYRLGRAKEAFQGFQSAYDLYEKEGDLEGQIEVLERMTSVNPDNLGSKIQLAELYTQRERYNRAGQLFEKAADALEEEGRTDDFIAAAERQIYCQETPNLDRRKRLAELYLDRREPEKALEHLQSCVGTEAADIELFIHMADALEQLDRPAEAVEVLEKVAPKLEQNHRGDRARRIYERILELDPDHETASQKIDRSQSSTSRVDSTGEVEQEGSEDVLADIEFIDEDDDFGEKPEQTEPQQREEPKTYGDFQETIPDLDVDEVRAAIDEMSESDTGEQPALEARQEFEGVEVVEDIEPTSAGEQLGKDKVDRELQEVNAFLQFGLLDEAEQHIEQTLGEGEHIKLYQKLVQIRAEKQDFEGQAEALIAMAKLTGSDSEHTSDYLAQAMEVTPNPSRVEEVAAQLGVNL